MNSLLGLLALLAATTAEDLLSQTEDRFVRERIVHFSAADRQPDADEWIDVAELSVANGDGAMCLAVLDAARDQGASGFWFHYLSGFCAEESFAVQRAQASYRKALELRPGYTAAWLRLAMMNLKAGDAEGMRDALVQVPADGQGGAVWLALKGQAAMHASDWDGAVGYFASAIQADPSADGLYVPLASALRKTGDKANAAKALSSRGARQPRPQDELIRSLITRSTSPGRLAENGILVLKNGDLARAQAMFERAVEYSTEDYPQALYGLGFVAEKRGQLEQAEQHYRNASRSTLNPRAALRLAGILASDGRTEEAGQLYRQVLDADPQSFAARANFANMLMRNDRCEAALVHYRWLIEHHRGERRGWQGTAICLDTADGQERQRLLLAEARLALPDDPIIMEYWVRAESLAGSKFSTTEVLSVAKLMIRTHRVATAWEAMAMVQARHGDFQQALATLKSLDESLARNGSRMDDWNQQLKMLFEDGEPARETGISNRRLN